MAARSLLIAPNWIGDAVMSQPLAALIRQRHPEPLDAVAAPHIAPVMRAMPQIAEVIEMPLQRGSLQWSARLALARQLRERHYQRCYVLPNNLKSALAPWLAGIPDRIGHRGEARYGLINRMHKLGHGRNQLMVDYYAHLAVDPGSKPAPRLGDPRLRISPAALQASREKFFPEGGEPVVVFSPGAEYGPAKRWPTRHFAALANGILARWPRARVVLLGAAKERALATEIIALAGRRLDNLCGETSLDEAMAVIALADAMVTNDSGLMHLAAALERPLVALFGSSDPRHTPPLSDQARVMWLQLSCSPCFARTCPLGHTDCLNKLTPDSALASLAQILQPEPAARRGS